MKTAIVEYHYHEEYLNTLIQLFPDSFVFTTKEIYNNLPQEAKDKATFYFKLPNQSTKNFINDIDTSQFDYLFVNTIQPSMTDLPNWLNFKPKCDCILTLHNLNAWHNTKFIPRKNLLLSIDSYAASLLKTKILRKFKYLSAVYHPITMMLYNYFPFTHNHFLNIPYSLAKENIKEESKDTIDFVIPGTVDRRRRDYDTILFKNTDYNLRLILLGELKDNVGSSENILTFKERVSTNIYDNYLQNSDVIICPCYKTTHTISAVDEEYGLTKSPNIFECIKWRKPLMIPFYVTLDERIRSSTIQYNSFEDFYKKVIYLMEDLDRLKELKKNAKRNSKHFTKEVVRKQLFKLLGE